MLDQVTIPQRRFLGWPDNGTADAEFARLIENALFGAIAANGGSGDVAAAQGAVSEAIGATMAASAAKKLSFAERARDWGTAKIHLFNFAMMLAGTLQDRYAGNLYGATGERAAGLKGKVTDFLQITNAQFRGYSDRAMGAMTFDGDMQLLFGTVIPMLTKILQSFI